MPRRVGELTVVVLELAAGLATAATATGADDPHDAGAGGPRDSGTAGRVSALSTVLKGAAAGVAGAAVMTAVEKVEQRLTGRPDSFVPGRTLAHLLRLSHADRDRPMRNLAMHFGTGAFGGVVRAGMARANLRGPWASLMHSSLRLSLDQTLENATGVGAPPWTWPRDELVIDLLHKEVYSQATGAIVDALVAPAAGTSARRPLQGLRLRGFA
jgi:hypothetical protein